MRRSLACLAGLGLALGAAAQTFPAKPVHIVVPNPPGGTVEIVARAVAQGLGPAIGQPVIVELRPGGNNVIGSDVVARAAPDGYTLLLGGTHVTINPLLRKLPYDGLRAFAPIALLAATPNVIAVRPSLPVHSVAELIALAKARPGELNLATASPGNGIHLAAQRFQTLAGIDMNLVPFQGGVQAALSVAGEHSDVLIAPLSDAMPHVESGRVRLLAVTSPRRFDMIADVPTLAESGFPGFEALQWFGAFAPAGTPKPVIERLSAAMLRALDDPEARAAFAKLGLSVMPMGPQPFADFLGSETRMFAAAVRDAHVTAE